MLQEGDSAAAVTVKMSTTDEEDGVDISQLEENGFMALDECGDDDEDEVRDASVN